MKRALGIILVLVMVFTLCSCKKKDEIPLWGELTKPGQTAEELNAAMNGVVKNRDHQNIYFDDLTTLLQALESGRIVRMSVPKCVADYILIDHDAYAEMPIQNTQRKLSVSLSMAVKEEDAELLVSLNTAIAELKANGTIAALYAQYVTDASGEAVPVELPKIDGAKTVKVVVTGDLPPLDYITADGKAAGFNVALLSAISEAANLNLELVMSNAASRPAQLSSGKADVIFWMRNHHLIDGDGTVVRTDSEAPDGIVMTEAYLTEDMTIIGKK